MFILQVLAFFITVISVANCNCNCTLPKECGPEPCFRVECPLIRECIPPEILLPNGYCNCCPVCKTVVGLGERCDDVNIVCGPCLICQKGICVK